MTGTSPWPDAYGTGSWKHWIGTIHGPPPAPSPRCVAYLSAEFLPAPTWERHAHLASPAGRRRRSPSLGHRPRRPSSTTSRSRDSGTAVSEAGGLFPRFPADATAFPPSAMATAYEFGIFDQEISDGWPEGDHRQVARHGEPWEISRPEIAYTCTSAATRNSTPTKRGRSGFGGSPAGRQGSGLRHPPIPDTRARPSLICSVSGSRRR